MKDNIYIPKWTRRFLSSMNYPKSEWRPIWPQRYLYHFTRGGSYCRDNEALNYRRLSIYLYGLLGKDKGTCGVWANRQIDSLTSTYPILLDGFEFGQYDYVKGLESYDVWRIDTKMIRNKWYLDPNMQDMSSFCDTKAYAYTENSISPFALKLFNIKVDEVHFYLYPRERVRFQLIPVKIHSSQYSLKT
jgi:hypothetical protein